MAVAVKNASEAVPQSPFQRHRLAVNSLVGALYVLGSIGLVFYGIPELWWKVLFATSGTGASFVLTALQLVVMVAAVAGLVILGVRLVGKSEKGLKAGIFLGFTGLLLVAYVTWLVGKILEATFFGDPSRWTAGIIVTLLIGAGLLYLAVRFFLRPGFEDATVALDDQGWFSATAYKRSQGQRVRRGTTIGILILAVCGVWTLAVGHHTLDTIGYQEVLGDQSTWVNNWALWLPFTGDHVYIPVLSDVRFTLPLLLLAAAGWFAYRIVNFPVFADFLIATEAEINKVSWTTRKRLVQDTIVVLTTVILLTVFLFFVDILWGYLLSRVGVLKTDTNQPGQEQREDAQPW
jgi:preprotein translocase SecE subunit